MEGFASAQVAVAGGRQSLQGCGQAAALASGGSTEDVEVGVRRLHRPRWQMRGSDEPLQMSRRFLYAGVVRRRQE